jgi:hypothetical protein
VPNDDDDDDDDEFNILKMCSDYISVLGYMKLVILDCRNFFLFSRRNK